jgi:hypothetical protein
VNRKPIQWRGWLLTGFLLTCLAVVPNVTFAAPAGVGDFSLAVTGRGGCGAYNESVVLGSYAYVATGHGLDVVRVSYPDRLLRVGRLDLPGVSRAIDIENGYAYLACSDGLRIVNIDHPTHPVEAGFYATPASIYDVDVSGTRAYCAGGGHSFLILDVADPLAISPVGFCDFSGQPYAVERLDNYAYVADGQDGLVVVDVSTPAAPFPAAACDTPNFAVNLCLGVQVSPAGRWAFVADRSSGLQIIDILNPLSPAIVGSLPAAGGGITVDVAIVANSAYVADTIATHTLKVADVSNKTAPVLVGQVDTRYDVSGVTVSGGYAFLCEWDGGMESMDVDPPTAPASIDTYDVSFVPDRLDVQGNYAYLVGATEDLATMDISDPATPRRTAKLRQARLEDVQANGAEAYGCTGLASLTVYDLAAPNAPVLATEESTSYPATSLRLFTNPSRSIACVTTSSDLRILSIVDPDDPHLQGWYSLYAYCTDVELNSQGTLAYVLTADGILKVLEVGNPSQPFLLFTFDGLGPWPQHVAVEGDHAYIADWGNQCLTVLDLSDPVWGPVLAGTVPTRGEPYDVALAGHYAFVAVDDQGVQVFDVSDPSAPAEVAWYDTPGGTRSLCIRGSRLYATCLTSGWLYVFSFTDVPADVSGDQAGDAADLAVVLQVLAGRIDEGGILCPHPGQADFDGDGALSAADAVSLANWLAGNI